MLVRFFLLAGAVCARAYWLMGANNVLTTERIDPIVSPGKVASHVHSVVGGSNFRFSTDTAQLRQSECTSVPIPEDKSNYWFPHVYFQWTDGSFTSLTGGVVIYYLFSDEPGSTTPFPDDFRMLSGDPLLRTYNSSSYAQQAVSFLCLNFSGISTRHNEFPAKACPSGLRAQINFPSCWDGKNTDSPDHKSHVAFPSDGPDRGSCKDPKFPFTLVRLFIEVYWDVGSFEKWRYMAKNTSQPFVKVFSMGDPTGYGYHADFINGWDKGVLKKAVDGCHCNIYGDLRCCVAKGIFSFDPKSKCRMTASVDEKTTGTLPSLPGRNPVQPFGKRATVYLEETPPPIISPVYVYRGDEPPTGGDVVGKAHGSETDSAPVGLKRSKRHHSAHQGFGFSGLA